MTEQIEKKGMSKGCLIGLIVAGVLLLLVIIGGVTCWMNKDALARYGAVTMVQGVRTMIAANPAEGVDTVSVFAATDAFVEKLKNDEEVKAENIGMFMQALQPIVTDELVDANETQQFVESMVDMYPDLAELVAEPEIIDSIFIPEDSTVAE